MNFNKHLELRGKHSMLSPSQPYWLNYDAVDLRRKFESDHAQTVGTLLHSLAETLITNNIKLKKVDKNMILVHLLGGGVPRSAVDVDRLYPNFMTYVNDAIGYKLTPEQILYYSNECFGTADAIAFRNNFLRIHDYKSGVTPAKMEQLLIYAALFCLEYKIKPNEIETELRIYQNDHVLVHNATAEDIVPIMDIIQTSTKCIQQIRMEG